MNGTDARSYKDALTTEPVGNETPRRIKTRIIRREFPHLDDYLAGLIADAWIHENEENKNMWLVYKDDRGEEQKHLPEQAERRGDISPAPSLEPV